MRLKTEFKKIHLYIEIPRQYEYNINVRAGSCNGSPPPMQGRDYQAAVSYNKAEFSDLCFAFYTDRIYTL